MPDQRRSLALSICLLLVTGAGAIAGQGRPLTDPPQPLLSAAEIDALAHLVVPEHSDALADKASCGLIRCPSDVRTIDGTGNNRKRPDWGAANVPLVRRAPADYEDGTGSPAGQNRSSAREISNFCVAQAGSIPNSMGASDFVWQWGQFLDHDLDLSPEADPREPFPVAVPLGDPFFDPTSIGGVSIGLNRSQHVEVDGVRQQVNVITAFIDASNVYGSDLARALELRTLDGTGRLRTSAGNLLPFNTNGFANAPNSDPSLFLAGDVRANEQVGLTAMHTLFVREHNFWANMVGTLAPGLDGDEIYEAARAIVGAEMQAITYREFLPVLLGPNALRPYRAYDRKIDPGIANEFATAAYRVGHTLLSSNLLRLDADGNEIPEGHLSLAESFFAPDRVSEAGIAPVLRGLASQSAQEVDSFLVNEVRNFLFGPPGAGGFDLASLNIQRGRDHGLPSYNQVRIAYGLAPAASFADISPDPVIQANLAAAYVSVDDVDLWVGGLAEPHRPGALVGSTFFTILRNQFERLRDGDRFWYQYQMPRKIIRMIEDQTLARVIRRNTVIGDEIQNDVFHVAP